MLPFPQIDPVLFSFGPFAVRWYGLMYLLGFAASWFLVQRQLLRDAFPELTAQFDNLNMTLVLAVVVGGRLGYVGFYNPGYYLRHLGEIPATWHGGMSFHGAVLAVFIAGWIFCRLRRLDFWRAADLYVVTFPVGLGLGRLGNFINGELYGRVSGLPWAMVFPGGGPLPRHPSQMYEFLLEGLALFSLLWSQRAKSRPGGPWPSGSMVALFFAGYGAARIVVEFFREPDPQIGFLLGHVTMGQTLSAVMIAAAVYLWFFRRRPSRTGRTAPC